MVIRSRPTDGPSAALAVSAVPRSNEERTSAGCSDFAAHVDDFFFGG